MFIVLMTTMLKRDEGIGRKIYRLASRSLPNFQFGNKARIEKRKKKPISTNKIYLVKHNYYVM